jgi:membrane-associated protease RseP (regulator of RpoE activity)
MSGPKHLWSGDWRQDSADASEARANRRATPAEPDPAVEPALRPRRAIRIPRPPRPPRALPIALVAVLFLAAAAYGLSALLSSSGTKPSTTAAATSTAGGLSAVPPATTTASALPRPVNWLGMQIQTLPPGAAVIETVGQGSPGDTAGLEPGDVIAEVNHRNINGAGDISAAIRGLHTGDVVEIQVSHGSALYNTEATLTAPPSVGP